MFNGLIEMIKNNVTFESEGDKIAGVLFMPEMDKPFPVLIICHGSFEFKENYFELCEFLSANGIAALAIDMHGHGESEGDRFNVNIREWVEDIRAAIDFLEANPKINHDMIGAFGLSSGGTAILEAALVEPRLKALITLDATVRTTLSFSEKCVFRILNSLGWIKKKITKRDLRVSLMSSFEDVQVAVDPEINQKFRDEPLIVEALSSFPFPGATQFFIVNTIKRVNKIAIPTLVLHGAEDQLDPPETAQMLYDALTCEKELHIIPDNGHVGHLDKQKQSVIDLTVEWLQKYLV